MKTLQQIHKEYGLNRTPYSCDKESTHGYISSFYEDCFAEFAHKEIVLLEIGVWYGGSIFLWSKYFPKGTIYGMDTEDASKGNIKAISNVKLLFANAYLTESLKLVPQCDIIIDDGPHTFTSHVFLIRNYTSKLKPGGVMVIEDVTPKWADELVSIAKEIGFPDAKVIRKKDPGDTLVVIRKGAL